MAVENFHQLAPIKPLLSTSSSAFKCQSFPKVLAKITYEILFKVFQVYFNWNGSGNILKRADSSSEGWQSEAPTSPPVQLSYTQKTSLFNLPFSRDKSYTALIGLVGGSYL